MHHAQYADIRKTILSPSRPGRGLMDVARNRATDILVQPDMQGLSPRRAAYLLLAIERVGWRR